MSHYEHDLELLYKPLYEVNLDSKESEKALLRWINTQYYFDEYCTPGVSRKESQTVSLGFYQGLVPQYSGQREIWTGSDLIARNQNRVLNRLILPMLGRLANEMAAKLAPRRMSFQASPVGKAGVKARNQAKNVEVFTEVKTQQARQEQLWYNLTLFSRVYGEMYLETFWDENEGPVVTEEVHEEQQVLDGEGKQLFDSEGSKLTIQARKYLGDTKDRMWDPRHVIVQPAENYGSAEWVILVGCEPVTRVRLCYPECAKKIQPSRAEWCYRYDANSLDYNHKPGHTLVFKLYHRVTPELPHGRLIIATPDVILYNEDYPHKLMIEKRYFPVIQVADTEIPGSSRGHASTLMDKLKSAEAFKTALYNKARDNASKINPHLYIPSGGVNAKQFDSGKKSIISVDRGYTTPGYVMADPVPQGIFLLIQRIEESMARLANVPPTNIAMPIPNTESGKMIQDYDSAADAHNQPVMEKIQQKVVAWMYNHLAIAASEYKNSDKRTFQFYGRLNKFISTQFDVEDLAIDASLRLDTLNSFSTSLQSRMQEITQLAALAPSAITESEKLDLLEIGDPRRVYDMITATPVRVDEDLDKIVRNENVAPIDRHSDLINSYDHYRKQLNKPEFSELLAHPKDHGGIGARLITRMKTLERLIQEMFDDPIPGVNPQTGQPLTKGDMPIVIPGLNQPMPMRMMLYAKYPDFPAFPMRESPIDPFEIQQQALPNTIGPTLPELANQLPLPNQPEAGTTQGANNL